jgi:hypothetical protein
MVPDPFPWSKEEKIQARNIDGLLAAVKWLCSYLFLKFFARLKKRRKPRLTVSSSKEKLGREGASSQSDENLSDCDSIKTEDLTVVVPIPTDEE